MSGLGGVLNRLSDVNLFVPNFSCTRRITGGGELRANDPTTLCSLIFNFKLIASSSAGRPAFDTPDDVMAKTRPSINIPQRTQIQKALLNSSQPSTPL